MNACCPFQGIEPGRLLVPLRFLRIPIIALAEVLLESVFQPSQPEDNPIPQSLESGRGSDLKDPSEVRKAGRVMSTICLCDLRGKHAQSEVLDGDALALPFDLTEGGRTGGPQRAFPVGTVQTACSQRACGRGTRGYTEGPSRQHALRAGDRTRRIG